MLLNRLLLLVIGMTLTAASFAQQPNETSAPQAKLDDKASQVLSLDMQLAGLANKNVEQTTAIKLNRYLSMKPLAAHNVAEQCLIHYIQGNISYSYGDINSAIEHYLKAKTLVEKLVKQQIESPPFYQIDWQLAESYAKQQDYKNAVEYKKSFFQKYRSYYYAQQNDTVTRLSQEYNMDLKQQQNQLLEQQNQVKAAELENSHQQEQMNELSLWLIVAALLFISILMMRQIWLRTKLQRIARLDSLTGLANRKALFEIGEPMLKQAQQQQLASCVMLFDIDHFKQINDSYGHQVGDEVLQQVALLAQETMRTRDFIARFGGEEFIALLPDVDFAEAKAIAERLREKIQQHDFVFQQHQVSVTISAGVAFQQPAKASLDHIIHHADELMYLAKKAGRNQVVCQQIA